jgi:hypothetical protein
MCFVSPCAPVAGNRPSRTHYEVLGISADEQDPNVIEEAAVRSSSHARTYQLKHEAESTLRLNEIALALVTLLDNVRRREYDKNLAAVAGPDPPPARPAVESGSPPFELKERSPPIRETDMIAFSIDEAESCDVKLVHRTCAAEVRYRQNFRARRRRLQSSSINR